MKKNIAIVVLIILGISIAYSQNFKVVDTLKSDIKKKYEKVSELDTIKIIYYSENCIDCIEEKTTFFFYNNYVNIIFEDSFITNLQIIDTVSCKDSLKVESIARKIENKRKLKNSDYRFINFMFSKNFLKLVQKPTNKKVLLCDIEFKLFITEMERMENLIKTSRSDIEKNKKVAFDINNERGIIYFSDFNVKNYLFEKVLYNFKPIE